MQGIPSPIRTTSAASRLQYMTPPSPPHHNNNSHRRFLLPTHTALQGISLSNGLCRWLCVCMHACMHVRRLELPRTPGVLHFRFVSASTSVPCVGNALKMSFHQGPTEGLELGKKLGGGCGGHGGAGQQACAPCQSLAFSSSHQAKGYSSRCKLGLCYSVLFYLLGRKITF